MKKEILYVFSKEYKKEIEYREFMENNIDKFKLKEESESADEKIKRLQNINFKSNFNIKIN